MKKYLVALALVGLFILPVASQAITAAEIQAQIAALQAQLAQLLQLLAQQNSSITINSITAPNSLKVGELGTWMVNVTAPTGTNLTYQVAWGEMDGYAGVSTKGSSSELVNQTGTFTHAYNQAGTYTVRFKVFAKGLEEANQSITVVVGGNNNQSVSLTNKTFSLSTVYSSGNSGQPELVMRSQNIIKANNGDIFVSAFGPLYGYGSGLKNLTRTSGNLPNHSFSREVLGGIRTVIDESRGLVFYKVPSGKTVTVNETFSYPINLMLSGVYRGEINEIFYFKTLNKITYSDEEQIRQNISPIFTNKVNIIGETVPYLEKAELMTNNPGWIKLTGERLNKVKTVVIGTKRINVVSNSQSNTLSFNYGNLPAGSYPIYVEFLEGKSRTVYLTIGNTETHPTSLNIFIDPTTPVARSIANGQKNVDFAHVAISSSGGDAFINQISVGFTPASNANLVKNISIYDGSTLLGSLSSLPNQNVSSYKDEQWGSLFIPTMKISSNVKKVITIKADISPSGSGTLRAGIVGLTFPPVAGAPYQSNSNWGFGNQMTIGGISPNDNLCPSGQIIQAGQCVIPTPVPDGQVSPVILYPNGGEILISGQPKYITWDPKIHYGYFNVSIRGVTSGNEFIVKQNVLANYAARMDIPWTPESSSHYEEKSNTFIIRVCRVGTNLCDESNKPFTITSNNAIPQPVLIYHSADLNKNYLIEKSELDAYTALYQSGKVTLTQLTRVIQFYNSAGYKVQAGTEDGFAPIPKAATSASKLQLNQLANIAEALQKLADKLR